MSDILSAVALNQAQTQQQISIALLKQNLGNQEDVVQLVAQATETASLQAGEQPLNSSGTGQLVNVFV